MVDKYWITNAPITAWKNNKYITTWDQFDKEVRFQGIPLLKRLDEFPNSVLVTGCQRSGTTMLARLITQSAGMINYWFGTDDELDAALILSGFVKHEPQGRYCFQTTYLNASFGEYYEHKVDYKIIFMLRNPFSVVHSLLYNFNEAALDRLFLQCGRELLSPFSKWKYKILGSWSISRLHKACLLYKIKVSQLYDLKKTFDLDQLMSVDYSDLVSNRSKYLPKIYDFIHLQFENEYLKTINSTSLRKSDKLSTKERSIINRICLPVYSDLKRFCI